MVSAGGEPAGQARAAPDVEGRDLGVQQIGQQTLAERGASRTGGRGSGGASKRRKLRPMSRAAIQTR